jgi:hypothetical protein
MISFGHNLIGNNHNATIVFPTGLPNNNNDFVGSPSQVILPFVAPLDDNGGPTPTYRLIPGSLAIDQGKCNGLNSDQRHHHNDQTGMRTIDQPGVTNLITGCDIGAYELGSISENPAPIAIDDEYIIFEGDLLNVPATSGGGLLADDIDNDSLIVTSAGSFNSSAGSAEGTVELFADGSFVFQTIDPDANGVTDFTYTVSDLLNQDEGTALINIYPVNDAPYYQATHNHITATLNQDINIPAWAFDISAGPANENDQILTFMVEVVTGSPGFFAVLPSVNATTGNLTFKLSSAATGTAEVNIILQDDGGTDFGGVYVFTSTLYIHTSDLIFANSFE